MVHFVISSRKTADEMDQCVSDCKMKLCVFVLQDEQELEQISEQDRQKRAQVGDMRQKVAEAKSSLSTNRSRSKVLDALMQQKRSGKIPGILGRLVRPLAFTSAS